MKILLFGRNGQVGWELQRSLAPLGELVAVDRRSELCGELEQLDGIAATVRAVRPDVVVNAAAYTAVDKAESDRDAAHRINAEAPGVLAAEAQKLGAWFVHYSTDYVFDGEGTAPWREDAAIAPASVYGATKAEGEQLVAQSGARHLIFRTSWVYAARGGNFLHTMLRLAQEREKLAVVDDQFGAPTGAELIADVTSHALRQAVAGSADGGTYHLAAAGVTNWHGYASHVIEAARRSVQGEKIRAGTIDAVPSSVYKTAARRPHNSRLDLRKLQRTFGLTLPPWQHGVDRVLNEIGWAPAANTP
ncbi:dTDP-4-dehydrorhamnose reductase [Caenimonas sedimenti]|uniref:dTDP-4-dehydrorhamnose reductase n=1 Tax=Caenimonas sedimenti TaxID=2596921 RepID=A0A562ZH44_9BURK|nr:dTDP-4-dehydrorhamnose reductase [Caenimonas sedimenti]TWO67910.1 dTDP-4-dehydrorhamnose reductase [Caenimonas sedimenti]